MDNKGLFGNPLDGIDLGDLTGGNPIVPIQEGGEEGEGEGNDSKDEFESFDNFKETQQVRTLGDDFDEGDGLEDNFTETDEEGVSLFKAFAAEGIIDLGEDEEIPTEANMEWFSERAKAKLQKDLDAGINEYKDSIPSEIKELLENYEQGVPVHELLNAKKEVFDISNLSEDDLDKESTQRRIITEVMRLSGESEEDIKDTLIDYEDSGLLSKMAKKSHSKLVQHKEYMADKLVKEKKAQELERKQAYTTWVSDLKDTIDKREEIFPGVKLNEKQRKDLFNGITRVDGSGKNEIVKYREKNPDFDLQVDYLATVLKGDFSVFETLATTKAANNLREQANSKGGSASSKGASRLKGVNLDIMKRAIKF